MLMCISKLLSAPNRNVSLGFCSWEALSLNWNVEFHSSMNWAGMMCRLPIA